MGVRRESVELGMTDDGFTTTAAKAAAVMALLNRELDKTDGASVRANRSTSALGNGNGGISKTGQSARSAGNDLNKYTGRLSLLATTAATLGPALLPISATAVPAITGLTAGMGAAAGAVGVAVLAFHGLGDALKALDAYQLRPTDANLKKLQDTFGKLSPAAQDFVSKLDALERPLKNLQAIAQSNMFPGMTQGLDSLMSLLPEVQVVVRRIATELGSLSANAGRSLAGDADWQKFFTFIKQDAGPTLDAFARATGNVIAGFGSLLVAFRPLSDGFTKGMLDMSRSFREWAANLSGTEGFQHFVDYIQQNGPEVEAFFKAVATALVGLARAAAPWGASVLPILTDVANVFGVIANSPIGPVIYDAAAALLIFNRASGPFGAGIGKMTTGITGFAAQVRTLPADLRAMSTEFANLGRVQSASLSFMSNTSGAAGRVRGALSELGGAAKAAAGAGGLLLLVDGASRTNKALGTLESAAGGAALGFAAGGPLGAAIGGGIGLLTAFGHTTDDTAQRVQNLTAAFDTQTGAMKANAAAVIAQQLEQDGVLKQAQSLGVNLSLVTQAVLGNKAANDQLAQSYINVLNASEVDGDPNARLGDWQKLIDAVNSESGAVDGAGAAAKRQAEATGGAATAINTYSGASSRAAVRTQELAARMQAQRQAARQTAQGFETLGGSLNDAKTSLDQWIRDMANQADALRNFRQNAISAAKKGLDEGLIASLEKAGPEGALRMKQLANATQGEIGKANAAWQSNERQMREWVDFKVPPKKITVENAQANSMLWETKRLLDQLHDKHITVSTSNIRIGGVQQLGSADGSTVPKDGGSYADRYPYLLAPGEEVISNRYGQADRFRPLLKAINAGRLAGGGTVGQHSSRTLSIADMVAQMLNAPAWNQWTRSELRTIATANKVAASLDKMHEVTNGQIHAAAEAEKRSKELAKSHKDAAQAATHLKDATLKQANAYQAATQKAVDAAQAAVQAIRQHADAIRQDMAALQQSIAQRFTTDQLGNVQGMTVGDFQSAHPGFVLPGSQGMSASDQLTAQQQIYVAFGGMLNDRYQAQESNTDIARIRRELRRKGMKGPAVKSALAYLAQSASVDQLDYLAGNSTDAFRVAEAYAERNRAANQFGKSVAVDVYGQQQRQTNRHLQAALKDLGDLRGELQDANRELRDLKAAVHDAAKETGEAVAHTINRGVVTAKAGRR